MKKGNSFSSRNFKTGMYNTIIIVFVITIVILLNLFVSQLRITVDLTKNDVYTLTDDTISYIEDMDDDITIYYLVKEGSEYKVLDNILNEYAKHSDIKIVKKDPELYPQFAAQYTDEELSDSGNDVIVVNETKGSSRFIPFNDMYIEDYSVNYSTYQTEQTYTLDAEGRITSALQFVTEESHTKMYVVSAHDEEELGNSMKELIDKANIQIETLDVLTASSVPEDCSMLFINGPQSDISETELNMYKEYLNNGGAAILTAGSFAADCPNYNSLLEYYGVETTGGVVIEQEGNYLPNYPTYIASAFMSVTDEISSEFEMTDYLIIPVGQGLKIKDDNMRSTITVSEIATTSEGSYARTDPNANTLEKIDSDIEGPFSTVIQAVDTYKDKTAKVVVFASPYMFLDEWIGYYSSKNSELLLDTLDWMRGEDVNSIAVPQRSLDAEYLDIPMGAATLWGVIIIGFIPLTLIASGFIVWYRRRNH